MSSYTVSVMEEGQREETLALMAASFDKSLSPIFFLHTPTTLVVTHEGRVVAGLNLDVFAVNKKITMGYLGWLYTDSGHRGKGLAGMLLRAAIPFLQALGCTDMAGCVEGDNPASFKQLAREGFAPLPLGGQVKRFGSGLPRVWAHASRFFDMGYFLWHKSLDGSVQKPHPSGVRALVTTIAANMLLTLPIILGWNIPALLGVPLVQNPTLLPLALLLTITARTAVMLLVAKRDGIYLGWDTAYLTALLAPLLLGLPFPAVGNVYIKGSDWSLQEKTPLLKRMSTRSNTALALLFFLMPNAYTLITLLCDTLLFFYPFSGFNASRAKRGGWRPWLFSLALLLACIIYLLVY